MSVAKFNADVAKFVFEPSDYFTFKTLEELYKENGKDKVYTVRGMYINTKGIYGENPVIVCDDCYVSLPKHLTPAVKEIRGDKQLVEDVNNGKVGFEIYEYFQPTYKKTCYSINWLDI